MVFTLYLCSWMSTALVGRVIRVEGCWFILVIPYNSAILICLRNGGHSLFCMFIFSFSNLRLVKFIFTQLSFAVVFILVHSLDITLMDML